MQKLNMFWLHSNCPAKFKLIAADAVIKTKLLYGMDSAQLGEHEQKRINVMQLKISRKILGIKTTFIDRENNNIKVWKRYTQNSQQRARRNKQYLPSKQMQKQNWKQCKHYLEQKRLQTQSHFQGKSTWTNVYKQKSGETKSHVDRDVFDGNVGGSQKFKPGVEIH